MSTEQVIIFFKSFVKNAIDWGLKVVSVFLDIKKALHRVGYEILVKNLEKKYSG